MISKMTVNMPLPFCPMFLCSGVPGIDYKSKYRSTLRNADDVLYHIVSDISAKIYFPMENYTSTSISLIYTLAFIFNKWENCMYNDTGTVLR